MVPGVNGAFGEGTRGCGRDVTKPASATNVRMVVWRSMTVHVNQSKNGTIVHFTYFEHLELGIISRLSRATQKRESGGCDCIGLLHSET